VNLFLCLKKEQHMPGLNPISLRYLSCARLEIIRSSETNPNRIPTAATDRVNYEEALEEKMKNIRSSISSEECPFSGEIPLLSVLLEEPAQEEYLFLIVLSHITRRAGLPRLGGGFVPLRCDTHSTAGRVLLEGKHLVPPFHNQKWGDHRGASAEAASSRHQTP